MDTPDVLAWRDGCIEALDQTALPHQVRTLRLTTVDELVDAITRLAIRGAPLLGAAGALGVALAVRQGEREGWDAARLANEIDRIAAARPTAVNLAREVRAVAAHLRTGRGVTAEAGSAEAGSAGAEAAYVGAAAVETTAVETTAVAAAVEAAAVAVLAEADEISRRLSVRGAAFLREACRASGLADGGTDGAGRDRRLRVHTHCNTGPLACLGWGTALGVIRALHEEGALDHVIVDETRPLLQGARLTCWELGQLGIEHRLICDGAGPFLISQGLVDAVIVGADRIAANGDVANKIGTYSLALAAHRAGIPFVVAAPESTIDQATPSGAAIPIELRAEEEVTGTAAPAGTRAINFAFDVTPADLITAIVTQDRVVKPQPF
jgi:methylthioribose-1-phosphate isomerase